MKRAITAFTYTMLLIGIAASTRCGGTDLPPSIPKDMTLVYSYSTGSLPPPYAFSYRYEWKANGQATFSYERGYGAKSGIIPFVVDTLALSRFYDRVKSTLVRYEPPAPEDIPVGGSSEHLYILHEGVRYTVPEGTDWSYLVPGEANENIQAILRSFEEPLDE